MAAYDFELVLSRPVFEHELDSLFERTQGYVTVSFVGSAADVTGPANARCSWDAPTLAHAMVEVVAHVEAAAPGIVVRRVEADPLLSAREIAERVGRTVESVRLASTGQRGPGGFPAPEQHRLWRWSHISAWYGIDDATLDEAAPTTRAVNGWLALREVVPELAPDPRALVQALTRTIRASA
ncbi:hypothetical protein LO762_14115 [Actinocorallia sp. API 0066]|uniref:hypothetical protein n=1 Tax=Actinocorallia sp. API 0066 TaxID=2896846 RepID=UPI001E2D99E1|nr:hypothetical protein [Actinocorallia sp. API 0066]MCD0450318.1 hypothetical protein [Actinocorallia sp. API 0066]